MINNSVRAFLVVLIMLKVHVIMVEEVMGPIGTMRDSMRRNMRERTPSEYIVRLWMVLCHVHEMSRKRHASHVDNRAMAHTKEWIMGTTMLHRPPCSSLFHAICHNLLHMLLDLFLHHVLNELGLEWAITLD